MAKKRKQWQKGFECGIALKNYSDMRVGDNFEAFGD
jgi:hypothetical protein